MYLRAKAPVIKKLNKQPFMYIGDGDKSTSERQVVLESFQVYSCRNIFIKIKSNKKTTFPRAGSEGLFGGQEPVQEQAGRPQVHNDPLQARGGQQRRSQNGQSRRATQRGQQTGRWHGQGIVYAGTFLCIYWNIHIIIHILEHSYTYAGTVLNKY